MSDSDVVIRVEGLGKKYALHHEKAERYTALRDVLARQAKAAGRLLNPFTLAGQLHKAQREAAAEKAESEEEFWALKDVNFEIRRGERVGIIGRNGAGKSTLLKILSRITEPTTGRVEIRGRVASLLEVGTGFHPELTGRENIYLNGAILGMTRREIRSKFDEIVDFAEVEKFLDTPVKRYSSGMYVRLAFAVAAHLEPEILVVDEVLAVGDASFQKKCLGKMEDVAEREGRTVLLVSHQMNAVRALANTAICLASGRLAESGSVDRVISVYLDAQATQGLDSFPASLDSDCVEISSIGMVPSSGNVDYSDSPMLSMFVTAKTGSARSARIIASVLDSQGHKLFSVAHHLTDDARRVRRLTLELPRKLFKDGSYQISVAAGIPGQTVLVPETVIARFCVSGCTSGSLFCDSSWPGLVLPSCSWLVS
jgi:lipopolysaccharide transport system ATP-binding protein